jgi:hypothetical protein
MSYFAETCVAQMEKYGEWCPFNIRRPPIAYNLPLACGGEFPSLSWDSSEKGQRVDNVGDRFSRLCGDK